MKNSFKWGLVAVVVLAVLGATVYFGKPGAQKGALYTRPSPAEAIPQIRERSFTFDLTGTNSPPEVTYQVFFTKPTKMKIEVLDANNNTFVATMCAPTEEYPSITCGWTGATVYVNGAWERVQSSGPYKLKISYGPRFQYSVFTDVFHVFLGGV